METLRIVLADDHPIVLHGLSTLISHQPNMEVVGDASDGQAAMELCAELKPDVLVLDVSLPRLSGAKVARQLKQLHPEIKILALSVHDNHAYLRLLMESGADGYLVKRAFPSEVVDAIRTIAGGETYLDSRLAQRFAGSMLRSEPGSLFSGAALSEREAEVLRCVAQGYSAKEIAGLLSISGKTVDTYRARAMEKLGLEGRADVVRYAVHVGWLDGN